VSERIVRCRVNNRMGDPCSGEAVDPNADLLICVRHLAEAQRLIAQAMDRAKGKGEPT
jgi:hypothetical protein